MDLKRTLSGMSPMAIFMAIEDYVDSSDKSVYKDFYEKAKKFYGQEVSEDEFKKELFSYFSDMLCEKDKLGTLLSQITDKELRGLAAQMSGALKEGGLPDDEVMAFLDSADTALVNCNVAIKNEVYYRFLTGGIKP